MKHAVPIVGLIVLTFFLIFASSCRVQSPSPGVASGGAGPASAEEADSNVDPQTSLDTLSYISMNVAGPSLCLAGNTNDETSYMRVYQRPSSDCSPRRPLFFIAKGNGVPWSSESFFIKDGWLKNLDEVWYTETGEVKTIRIFRDNASGRKGVKMLPLKLKAGGDSWDIEPYVNEWWTDEAGRPSCSGVNPNPSDGESYRAEAQPVVLRNWLSDRRMASRDPNTWHDVYAIKLTDYWGKNTKEYYYYGRWTNPATGKQEALGWVKWEMHEGRRKTGEVNYRYLIECNVNVPCKTCPDP